MVNNIIIKLLPVIKELNFNFKFLILNFVVKFLSFIILIINSIGLFTKIHVL